MYIYLCMYIERNISQNQTSGCSFFCEVGTCMAEAASSAAALATSAGYPRVDMLGFRYKFINFGALRTKLSCTTAVWTKRLFKLGIRSRIRTSTVKQVRE